jgi:acyl carrier protein
MTVASTQDVHSSRNHTEATHVTQVMASSGKERSAEDSVGTPRTYERLTETMRKVFRNNELVATEDLTAQRVPGWDSLGHVRFLVEVERAFSVRFLATEIASLRTVGHLAKLIESKQSGARAESRA